MAIAVVLTHVSGCSYVMTGGATSVQSFYIISGFFIAMILDLKYKDKTQNGLFYSNRFIRIYSVYWLFLAIAIGLHVVSYLTHHHSIFDYISEAGARLSALDKIFLVTTNLGIVGQDWVLFLKLGARGLHWTTDFQNSSPVVVAFMLIPPAWSLGLEMSFYLLAPWILRRRTSLIAVLILLSLLCRYALWHAGLRSDPWSYRFFPSELGTFLLGGLAYRLIYRRIRTKTLNGWWKAIGLGIFPAIFFYPLYNSSNGLFFSVTQVCFLTYVAIAVPLLFRMTSAHRIDRQLGELSFPLYLCHLSVLHGLEQSALRSAGVVTMAITAVGISCGIAYLSAVYFDAPIDRIRQARVKRNREQHHEAMTASEEIPPPLAS